MHATLEAPRLLVVNRRAGEDIKRRRAALGMSVSKLAEAAKIDRGRLSALEAGDSSVRASTIGAVESALDRLEAEIGMDQPSAVRDPGDYVEFRLSGNFGVDVVVRGPVRDMDALEQQVERLLREMRSGDTPRHD